MPHTCYMHQDNNILTCKIPTPSCCSLNYNTYHLFVVVSAMLTCTWYALSPCDTARACLSDLPPSIPPSYSSAPLLPPPTGEAILNRVSPEYVVLTPPSALELAVRASGAFETLTWYYNGAGSGLFSLSNFGQVLNVDSTVVEDAGEYVAQLEGTYQLEVVFQVQPFSERNCFWHREGIDNFIPCCMCCMSQQPTLSMLHKCKTVEPCCVGTSWRDPQSTPLSVTVATLLVLH